jgi:hypothetical protein
VRFKFCERLAVTPALEISGFGFLLGGGSPRCLFSPFRKAVLSVKGTATRVHLGI